MDCFFGVTLQLLSVLYQQFASCHRERKRKKRKMGSVDSVFGQFSWKFPSSANLKWRFWTVFSGLPFVFISISLHVCISPSIINVQCLMNLSFAFWKSNSLSFERKLPPVNYWQIWFKSLSLLAISLMMAICCGATDLVCTLSFHMNAVYSATVARGDQLVVGHSIVYPLDILDTYVLQPYV